MSPSPGAPVPEPLRTHASHHHPWILTRDQAPAIILCTLLIALAMWLWPERSQPLVAKRWLGLPLEILGLDRAGVPAAAITVFVGLLGFWLGTGGLQRLRGSGIRVNVSATVLGGVWGVVACIPLVVLGWLLGNPLLASGIGDSLLHAGEAGLFEEVLFRGVIVLAGWSLVTMASPKHGPKAKWLCIGIGAALFAGAHQTMGDGAALAMYLASGVWLGWVLTRGGLFACVLAHCLYDFCVLAWWGR